MFFAFHNVYKLQGIDICLWCELEVNVSYLSIWISSWSTILKIRLFSHWLQSYLAINQVFICVLCIFFLLVKNIFFFTELVLGTHTLWFKVKMYYHHPWNIFKRISYSNAIAGLKVKKYGGAFAQKTEIKKMKDIPQILLERKDWLHQYQIK